MKILRLAPPFFVSFLYPLILNAQEPTVTQDDATITYPASYFEQYNLLSVSDMLDRIPGINVARQGNLNSSSGPGSSQGSDRRGLGLGGDQVLINGRRITGKENEGNSQLSRIPANQVERIEIIRGTSGDLDVRGATQVINIVLLEAQSRSSLAYEINTDHYHDGKIKPGLKLSLSGRSGNFDYLISGETEPRWEYRKGYEESILANGKPNDTVSRKQITDQQPTVFSTNLGYQFSDNDIAHFNLQYNENDAPFTQERVITNLLTSPAIKDLQFENINNNSDFWEAGGDYEHTFQSGSRWKNLFILNRKEDDRLRERFDRNTDNVKNLFLETYNKYEEKIFRTSYSTDLNLTQDLELGIERAQTTLNSNLKLGLLTGGSESNRFGGLTAVNDSNANVEEIRYEAFAVHNWIINSSMSLESTLIIEESTITQSGDVIQERDFDFVRPKLDYRFDITPTLQFRATIEKDVAQLSFNDFTANTPPSNDDDQNTFAGNPDIRQEQSWRYDINLEYRFNNDNGVINTNLFYHDLEDLIDRINVSTPTVIQSANGNIGKGKRYGGSVDTSLRLNTLNLPQLLITSRVELVDSSVRDPFLDINRPLQWNGKGIYQYGFRYDMSGRNINYGLNISGSFDGDQMIYDIDKIEDYYRDDFIIAFLEVQGWGGLIYRFEATNIHEQYRCRIRSRYVNGTIASGRLDEIEDSCSHAGEKYAIKIRGTF
ncbi:MAG: TonB-dependent receptor plug domain-containing protein [Gammaproteobacteria bacterium]|nr:TonB-dependent receptor plug domain-containing protein [Gammaproteobacteria bacterium]